MKHLMIVSHVSTHSILEYTQNLSPDSQTHNEAQCRALVQRKQCSVEAGKGGLT